jgi:hypothetical protein
MEVTALVTAWKDIDASQEASVVINGTLLNMPIFLQIATSVTLSPLRFYFKWRMGRSQWLFYLSHDIHHPCQPFASVLVCNTLKY